MSTRIVASASPRRQGQVQRRPSDDLRTVEIPSRLYCVPQLTGADFRLLALLFLLGARERPVSRPQAWLAEKLDIDRRTVRGCLARLERMRCLQQVHNTRVGGVFVRLAYRLTY